VRVRSCTQLVKDRIFFLMDEAGFDWWGLMEGQGVQTPCRSWFCGFCYSARGVGVCQVLGSQVGIENSIGVLDPLRLRLLFHVPSLPSDYGGSLELILKVIKIISTRSLSAIVPSVFNQGADVIAAICDILEYVFEISLGVPSVLFQVMSPHISKVAAFSRKVETCIGHFSWGIFTDNVIMLCHHVAEELSVLFHFD
jgi:hypothetical protein